MNSKNKAKNDKEKKFSFKDTNIKEYVLTSVVTAIVVIVLALALELELMFRTENKVNTEELSMKNLGSFCTIEQLEKRLKIEKDNYFICIKLAEIYESISDIKSAMAFYEQALKISHNSNFSIYCYAEFCARQKFWAKASKLAETLKGNTPQNNKYRAKIYKTIANTLEEEGEYLAAIKAYQIAYKYYKTISKKGQTKADYEKLMNDYSSVYIKLADDCIKKNTREEAIFNLNNSLKIKENVQAKYKLALALMDTDKIKAERLLGEVFKENPFIINPFIYNKTLEELIELSKRADDKSAQNYYELRLSNLKKKLNMLYIFKTDIEIQNTSLIHKKTFKSKNDSYIFYYDIKNNTNQDINMLFLKFEFYFNDTPISLETGGFGLGAYESIKRKELKLSSNLDLQKNQINAPVTIKYYARKQKKAPWTLVKISNTNVR